MREHAEPAILAWAERNLPGRLNVNQTARLLGFGVNDVTILMGTGHLTPLGNPATNSPKWFAAVEMVGLAMDKDWLHKATRELSKYWRNKRLRRRDGGRIAAKVIAQDPAGNLEAAPGGVTDEQ